VGGLGDWFEGGLGESGREWEGGREGGMLQVVTWGLCERDKSFIGNAGQTSTTRYYSSVCLSSTSCKMFSF